MPNRENMRAPFDASTSPEGGFAAEQSQIDAAATLNSEQWSELLPMTNLGPVPLLRETFELKGG